jgi:signal transduction histidine kinase
MIAREALNNIVRHADAVGVHIALEVDAQEVVLLIADDGRGFDPVRFRPGHFGLVSMRERTEALGGALELDSACGAGTRVRVRLPRAPAYGRSWSGSQ